MNYDIVFLDNKRSSQLWGRSDYVRDIDNRRSTVVYVYTLARGFARLIKSGVFSKAEFNCILKVKFEFM